MIQSSPNKLRMNLLVAAILLFGILSCALAFELATGMFALDNVFLYFLTTITFFIGYFLFVSEVSKVLILSIDETKIQTLNLITRREKTFLLDEIDSFKISITYFMYSGLYFELILFSNGIPLEPISLSYIGNLNQIIGELEKRLKNLSDDEYGIIQELRNQNQNHN